MSLAGRKSLSLDQAPPLIIPLSFFATAPVAVVAGGALLVLSDSVWVTSYNPTTIALTHLGTLGLLTMVMCGALYQLLPVVAGSPVPAARLAHAVHLLLAVGVALGTGGVWVGSGPTMAVAGGSLALAILGFAGPLALALARSPTVDATVWGMRSAVLCLVVVAALGLVMGQGHAGGAFVARRPAWIQVHLTVALLGWVGTLLMAVSWKVLPIFYLSPAVAPRRAALALTGHLLGLLGVLVGLAVGASALTIALLTLPSALVVWLVHPVATLRALRDRRRKAPDATVWFWQAGMASGLLCGPLAVAAVLSSAPVWPLLLGWVAVWGWGGMVMHGMLCRIVPFLVWFHRLVPLIGVVPVPPIRRILPDRLVRRAFALHLASVGLGGVAIALGGDLLARVSGAALVVVGASIAYSLVTALRVRAPQVT